MQETTNRLDLTDTHTERCKSYERVVLSKATLKTNLIGFIGFRTKTKGFTAVGVYRQAYLGIPLAVGL